MDIYFYKFFDYYMYILTKEFIEKYNHNLKILEKEKELKKLISIHLKKYRILSYSGPNQGVNYDKFTRKIKQSAKSLINIKNFMEVELDICGDATNNIMEKIEALISGNNT